MSSSSHLFSRRRFLTTSAAATSAALAAPALVTADKTESKPLIVGQGDYRYEVRHDWAQLPDKYTWQTTHNVAVDKAGQVYVIHEGREQLKDHPSIFVFDPEGRFVRAFGQQYQGGGHGIEVRAEGGEEFLYVCAYQQVKEFAKLSLTGEVVWSRRAPMDSGVYAAGEDTDPKKVWGRDRFMPTNFAFLADGGFLLADGYGSFYVHRYDKDGQWISCFGGPGDGEGKFNTPHGVWLDQRGPGEPHVVVCDRAHHTVQLLTLEGKHLQTLTGFGLPANIDTRGNLMLVPELLARVSILNEKNEVVAQLGADVERIKNQNNPPIRNDEKLWKPGRFVHPHDACFAADGSIFVAEWVNTGRISKLQKIA